MTELFGVSTRTVGREDTVGDRPNKWPAIVEAASCPFLRRKCLKNRKSDPSILIGTCTVAYGRESNTPVAICPHRFLERNQIFFDSIHLLTLHEPGNELHVVSEITVPGGSIDYVLASVRGGKVRDFVGIEIQTLDTTGSVWPERQKFLASVGVARVRDEDDQSFGMNWKMTAKTILMQLHHKIETFEHLSKHLVLAFQDCLLDYMQENFEFGHIGAARTGDSMHFHAYKISNVENGDFKMDLASRMSTDAQGMEKALGISGTARMELAAVVSIIESKISEDTRLDFQPVVQAAISTPPS